MEKCRVLAKRMIALTKNQQDNYLYRLFLTSESNCHYLNSYEDSVVLGYLTIIELSKEAGDQQMEFDYCLLIANVYIYLRRSDLGEEFVIRAESILPAIYTPRNCCTYYYYASDIANKLMRGEGVSGKVVLDKKQQRERQRYFIRTGCCC